jgi:hypothetical protein
MSRFASADGRPRIHIGAGPIADMTQPTIDEIAALTDLSGFLTKDGFSQGTTGGVAPTSGASEKVNLEVSGSVSYRVSMKFFRDDDTDAAWDAFDEGDQRYVVFCRKGGSGVGGAIAVGDEVEVYFGEILEKPNDDIAENTSGRFMTRLSTGAKPELDAVVVSS